MQELKERILRDGEVFPGDILKVSSFLNHQLDSELLDKIGKEISALFSGEKITKILTIEASGIAIGIATARYLQFVPVLFAKKNKNKNLSDDLYTEEAFSYTKGVSNLIQVEKKFLSKNDSVLIIDDFLANGSALRALIGITEKSGAQLVGCAVAIEKGYQGGGDELRKKGYRVESLATIDSMSEDGKIAFRN